MPVRECKRARVAVKKHVVLWSEHSGMNAKPKHDALYELARGIEFAGNPNIYSTYMDESIKSIIARLARTVHPEAPPYTANTKKKNTFNHHWHYHHHPHHQRSGYRAVHWEAAI